MSKKEKTITELQKDLEKWILDWHENNDFDWWIVAGTPRLAAVAACAVIKAAALGYQEGEDCAKDVAIEAATLGYQKGEP